MSLFLILYFSSNSCSTSFGQPCTHHQELTTAWCYSLVLVCAMAAGRLAGSASNGPTNRSWQPSCSHGTYQHEAITSRSRQLLMMPESCWAAIRREIKNTKSDIQLVFLTHTESRCTVNHTSDDSTPFTTPVNCYSSLVWHHFLHTSYHNLSTLCGKA